MPITNSSTVKFTAAAFSVRPSFTIATCVDWLTSSTIAVGHANGYLTTYSLAGPTPSVPLLTLPLHKSYILTLTSANPSRPYTIATTSTDGHIKLISLISPHMDIVCSIRSRLGTPTMTWCDALQVFICGDSTYDLRILPLRRFAAGIFFIRAKAMVTCVASSAWHPFVLAGSAAGEVQAANPVRRVFRKRLPVWQGIWFAHEWRRSTAAEESAGETAGLTRIVEAFKLDMARLPPRKVEDSGIGNGGEERDYVSDGVLPAAIYELDTAITSVCWNPNLRFGGWAAAAMGSGLLRVEDLAL
jgi:transcription factor C subunit 6